jgi:hypothetical protein
VGSLRKLTKYLTQSRISDNSTTQIETIPLFGVNSSVSIVTNEKLSLHSRLGSPEGPAGLCSVRASSKGGLVRRGLQHV